MPLPLPKKDKILVDRLYHEALSKTNSKHLTRVLELQSENEALRKELSILRAAHDNQFRQLEDFRKNGKDPRPVPQSHP